MQRIEVPLSGYAYPVLVGTGILSQPRTWAPLLDDGNVVIVSNEVVAPLYLEQVLDGLGSRSAGSFILPDGEENKTPANWLRILDYLADTGARRDTTLVALGGGVVGDMAGYAAAAWMRGIRIIQVPTTLLAQVDSSVGGKTGVNHPRGKNLIGAFHQPAAVVADISTLDTLASREYRAGLAEVVKTGAIRDPGFLDQLEESVQSLATRKAGVLESVVKRCVRNKAEVVAADEKEAGERALLNFGHTFGHAIETLTGYTRYLHGEAVAIGMIVAARLSESKQLCPTGTCARIERLLEALELPTRVPQDISTGAMLDCMLLDKKSLAGGMRLVLLRQAGEAFVTGDCNAAEIAMAIKTSQ